MGNISPLHQRRRRRSDEDNHCRTRAVRTNADMQEPELTQEQCAMLARDRLFIHPLATIESLPGTMAGLTPYCPTDPPVG